MDVVEGTVITECTTTSHRQRIAQSVARATRAPSHLAVRFVSYYMYNHVAMHNRMILGKSATIADLWVSPALHSSPVFDVTRIRCMFCHIFSYSRLPARLPERSAVYAHRKHQPMLLPSRNEGSILPRCRFTFSQCVS